MIRNYVRPTTDGRLGVENDAIAFWQSRSTTAGNRAEPFQLVNIPQLAKDIRRAAATAQATAHAIQDFDRRIADACERSNGRFVLVTDPPPSADARWCAFAPAAFLRNSRWGNLGQITATD